MSRYLLDTNISSNVTRPVPSEALLAWMGGQVDDNLFIASLTVSEIRRGILEKPAGRKRDQLDAWFPVRKGLRRFSLAACCHSMKGRPRSGPA